MIAAIAPCHGLTGAAGNVGEFQRAPDREGAPWNRSPGACDTFHGQFPAFVQPAATASVSVAKNRSPFDSSIFVVS